MDEISPNFPQDPLQSDLLSHTFVRPILLFILLSVRYLSFFLSISKAVWFALDLLSRRPRR